MNTLNKKILYISFGLSLLIMIGVEITEHVASQKQSEDQETAKKTHVILRTTGRLISKLTDAETGIRGYILTGDKNFIEPFESALIDVPEEYKKLSELDLSGEIQKKRLDTLKTLISIRMSFLKVHSMFNLSMNSALPLLVNSLKKGKFTQDNIRRIINDIDEEEKKVIYSNMKSDEKNASYIEFTSVAGPALSVVILLALSLFLYMESKKRYRSEQELIETKNFLALTLNNIGEAVISTDALSNIIYMNEPAEKFLGWEFNEARSKKFNEVVNVVDAKTNTKLDNLVSRAMVEKNIPWENSKIVVNREGKCIHIDNLGASITDENGNSTGAILVLRDISEYKQAQDKIDESRALASSTLNSLSAYIAILDENGVINSVNKSWAAFAFLNENVIRLDIGTNYIEACEKGSGKNSEEAKKFANGIRKVLSGELEEFLVEYPFNSYSGERWFKGKAAKFVGKGPNKVVITLEDITYKKEAENEIKSSEEKFRSMVQNSSDIISLINKEGTILYVSPSSRNILGYERDKRIGKNIFNSIHPDDLPKIKAVFNHLLKTPGEVTAQELKYMDAEGKYIFLEIVFNNLLNDPNVNAIVLNSRDISERKRSEERLINALNEKELLLKEIHHRVKNNLQVISSLLKLQSNHFNDFKLKAAFDESISRVRSMSLVHQKLYQTNNQVSVNFNEYLNNFVSYLFQTFGAAKSRIRANILCDENITMSVDDAIPCGLIINELVTNSFKYGFPEGRTGSITVSLEHNEAEDEYNLVVADDGAGMEPGIDIDDNPSSFGFQLVSTLIQQMNGKIEIENNNGTTFKITLKSTKYKVRA